MSEKDHAVSAVLFDYGLVLTGPADPAARAEMRRVLGVEDERVQAAYWRYRDAYDRGALSGVAYWHEVAGAVGQTLDAESLAALIAADNALWTQPNQPMIDWAARLQRVGIKTGILSNIGDEMELGVRARFAWLAEFAHHTFSHRLGMAKPDAAIYRHAAEGLGIAAREILFVDDRIENIEAARGVGMMAVQYAGQEAFVGLLVGLGLGWLMKV
jgi:putative hydrolase of the HAD superfamily